MKELAGLTAEAGNAQARAYLDGLHEVETAVRLVHETRQRIDSADRPLEAIAAYTAAKQLLQDAVDGCEEMLLEVTGWLWDQIAGPVLDALGIIGPPETGQPWPRLFRVNGLLVKISRDDAIPLTFAQGYCCDGSLNATRLEDIAMAKTAGFGLKTALGISGMLLYLATGSAMATTVPTSSVSLPNGQVTVNINDTLSGQSSIDQNGQGVIAATIGLQTNIGALNTYCVDLFDYINTGNPSVNTFNQNALAAGQQYQAGSSTGTSANCCASFSPGS